MLVSYERSTHGTTTKKSSLASLIPGLGQIYNKQKAKGFIFLAVTVAFVLYFIVLAAPEFEQLNHAW